MQLVLPLPLRKYTKGLGLVILCSNANNNSYQRSLHFFIQHNMIQIHNNVLWDWQYYVEYSLHSIWIWRILCRITSIPNNIVKDLNNVMGGPYQPIMFIIYSLWINIYLLIIAHIMVTLKYPWPCLCWSLHSLMWWCAHRSCYPSTCFIFLHLTYVTCALNPKILGVQNRSQTKIMCTYFTRYMDLLFSPNRRPIFCGMWQGS